MFSLLIVTRVHGGPCVAGFSSPVADSAKSQQCQAVTVPRSTAQATLDSNAGRETSQLGTIVENANWLSPWLKRCLHVHRRVPVSHVRAKQQ